MTTIQSSLNNHIERDSFSHNNYSAKDTLLTTSDEVEDFDVRQAVVATEEENQNELVQVKEYLNCCLEAEKIILESGSYEDGLAALHEDDQNKWKEAWLNDEDSDISSATAEGLLSWIEDDTKFYKSKIFELKNRSKIKQQILGKSFLSDKELDKYARYESHLDRKFEKTLAMIIKLQDLRETKSNL